MCPIKEYTTKGNVQSITYFTMKDDGKWHANNKVEYTFDFDTQTDELIIPKSYDTDMFKSRMTGYTMSHKAEGKKGWKESFSGTYNYKSFETTLSHAPEAPTLNLFPNPTTNYVQVQFKNFRGQGVFRLFSLTGADIMSTQLADNTERINLANLNTGMYIYNVTANNTVFTGKLIVE